MANKRGNGETPPSLIEFPCDFTIKAMGKSSASFVDLVLGIIRQHFPEFSEQQLQKRFSQYTNYISLTFTIHAQNQEQLDNLYRQLSGTPEVLVVI
jgi:putative lipoic acid-binding regulatory protein